MKKSPRIRYRDLMNGPPAAAEPVAPAEPAEAPIATDSAAPSLGVERSTRRETDTERRDGVPIATAPLTPPQETEAAAGVAADDREYLIFRVGSERFALRLDAVDEAIDFDAVQTIPGMGDPMVGVIPLRGELVPLYPASAALGVSAHAPTTALIFLTPRGRVAMAVDDVDDVLSLRQAALLRSPVDFGDGMLLGVARRGTDLIGVLDAACVVAACRAAADAGAT